MKRNVGSAAVAIGAFAAITIVGTGAYAQNTAPAPVSPMPYPTPPGRYPAGAERTEFARPNPVMLGAGGLAFAGAYIPGVVVAASSDHDGDEWLYAPVIGPWLDLATRGCGDDPNTPVCGVTAFDRAALISSGVFQAFGLAAMLGAFTLPQKRLATTATIQLAPATFDPRSQGIVAFGQF
jgi:hypothetical protein